MNTYATYIIRASTYTRPFFYTTVKFVNTKKKFRSVDTCLHNISFSHLHFVIQMEFLTLFDQILALVAKDFM